MMIELDIICPLYNGYQYLENLYNSLLSQEKIKINRLVFPITITNDDEMKNVISFLKKKKESLYFEVSPKDFSHSLTREKAIRDYCSSKIVVMISQDIVITGNDVIFNLIESIEKKESAYNYARQVCNKHSIEKYIRRKNYPKNSYFIGKDDIRKMQMMAFFASDACSAYDREVFLSIGGYKGYDVMMCEDMLYSKFILEAGYKKKYCSNAIVEHSHNYTLKQLYQRYYQTGKFYKDVQLFNNYKSVNSGLKLAIYVFVQALIRFDIITLVKWMPNMAARFLGMKRGKR